MNNVLRLIIILIAMNLDLNGQTNSYPAYSDKLENNNSASSLTSKIETIPLVTSEPVKVMVVLIAIPEHPHINNEWPVIKNPDNYPDEKFPLLGTFHDGQKLREYLNDDNVGPIHFDSWYKKQIEEYFKLNSNRKFEVEIIFPKTPGGRVYQTTKNYEAWKKLNNGDSGGMVSKYNNWRKMAKEVMEKIHSDHSGIFSDIKLINFVYLVTNDEYSVENFSAFSYDIPFQFTTGSGNIEMYNGHVITTYTFKVLLHEIFHRIGSLVDDPEGFEGLPDRTTLLQLNAAKNMTWGYDIMYNKGYFPSENALYGAPPMLTLDRIFFEWIEPDEVLTVSNTNVESIKLKDVNLSLTQDDKADGLYRAVKVMIHEDYLRDLDEYFLIEFRNGTNFDRNFYNIHETDPHKGILIWHVKENSDLINRSRTDDHLIDLEVAVPYNGWYGVPIPNDDFPRNYYRPYGWREEINAAGDYDYYDDSSSEPPIPDGGMHRWELTDDTHPAWAPYYVRRNSLRSNFFTDEPIRGFVTNRMTNDSRPSTKDWSGKPTYIKIENIKKFDNHMEFDVFYSGGVSDVNDGEEIFTYNLEANYPNPFNPRTNIKYSVPEESHVEIKIINLLGQTEAVLLNEIQTAGNHSILFNGSDLPSGIYLYSLKSNDFIQTRKMLLLK